MQKRIVYFLCSVIGLFILLFWFECKAETGHSARRHHPGMDKAIITPWLGSSHWYSELDYLVSHGFGYVGMGKGKPLPESIFEPARKAGMLVGHHYGWHAKEITAQDIGDEKIRCLDADSKPMAHPSLASKAASCAIVRIAKEVLGPRDYDFRSFMDEVYMDWVRGYEDQVADIAKELGYTLKDLGINCWEEFKLPRHDVILKTDAERRALYAWMHWREQIYLKLIKLAAQTSKEIRPDCFFHAGVFTTHHLRDRGYNQSVPWLGLRNIEEIDIVEVDTYVWVGHDDQPYWVEEAEKLISGLTGKPQIPLRILWPQAKEWVIRLALATSLLCNEDIYGCGYFVWAPDIASKGRWGWPPYVLSGFPLDQYWGLIEATMREVHRARDLMGQAKEEHNILIIAEDPLWHSCPRYPATERPTIARFDEAYRLVKAIGREADFCVPRQIEQGIVKPGDYDIIVVNSFHVSDKVIGKLIESKRPVIAIKGSFAVNEFDSPRKNVEEELKDFMWINRSRVNWQLHNVEWVDQFSKRHRGTVSRFRDLIEYNLKSRWRPTLVSPLVTLDYRSLGKKHFFIIFNYSESRKPFTFSLDFPAGKPKMLRTHQYPGWYNDPEKSKPNLPCEVTVTQTGCTTTVGGTIQPYFWEMLIFEE